MGAWLSLKVSIMFMTVQAVSLQWEIPLVIEGASNNLGYLFYVPDCLVSLLRLDSVDPVRGQWTDGFPVPREPSFWTLCWWPRNITGIACNLIGTMG